MQAISICLLVYSAMTTLLLADYDNQALRGGLAVVGFTVGLANVLMFARFVFCIIRMSIEKVNKVVALWLWRTAGD